MQCCVFQIIAVRVLQCVALCCRVLPCGFVGCRGCWQKRTITRKRDVNLSNETYNMSKEMHDMSKKAYTSCGEPAALDP